MMFVRNMFLALCLFSTAPLALAAKTYQVTGPILEVTDSMITVQKGSEKWQIDRDAATKAEGELKVGTKVTIEYTMKAVTISAKPEKTKKPAK